MEHNSVIVIGAGVAGLAAAKTLLEGGTAVTLLEARGQPGGRILTIKSQPGDLPIELGAEFVHGAQNATWDLIHAANLQTQTVPDRHWTCQDGSLEETSKFWEEFEEVNRRLRAQAADTTFSSFLAQAQDLSDSARTLALEYVEGFHAAEANRIGVRSLVRAETAAEQEKGTHQFRITQGYASMVHWLFEHLCNRGIEVYLNTTVKVIRWKPGQVEVETHTPYGWRRFSAPRGVITLPLGVLQQTGPEAVWFEPNLADKEQAIRGLAMGAVCKMTLRFRQRFWPVDNFGFIHCIDPWWPTWWSDERGLLLTCWAGGTRALRLQQLSFEERLLHAQQSLSQLFKTDQKKITELLLDNYQHDWAHDPFSRGAYSYTPAGMLDMPQKLAEPVSDTLFFAGEATDSHGDQGTVHGALASGLRAASEILKKVPAARRSHTRVYAQSK
jgi:monoamine oxidase